MRGLVQAIGISGFVLLAFATATAAPDDHNSVVIVYRDGHRQSLSTEEIQRINLKAPASIVYKDGHREKISANVDRIEFSDSPFLGNDPGPGPLCRQVGSA